MEKELELINRFAKAELTAEQVYTFSVRLCDNEVDTEGVHLVVTEPDTEGVHLQCQAL